MVRSISTPNSADQQRGEQQGHPVVDAELVERHPGHEGAHHVLGAVGEVDDVEQAEDDRQPEAEDGVERAVDQADQQLAAQQGGSGRRRFPCVTPGPERRSAAPGRGCRTAYFLTSGQRDCASGWKASAAGMV
jgi:hypothetical protein